MGKRGKQLYGEMTKKRFKPAWKKYRTHEAGTANLYCYVRKKTGRNRPKGPNTSGKPVKRLTPVRSRTKGKQSEGKHSVAAKKKKSSVAAKKKESSTSGSKLRPRGTQLRALMGLVSQMKKQKKGSKKSK